MSKTTSQIAADCGIDTPDAIILDRVLCETYGDSATDQRLQDIIGALYRRIEKLEGMLIDSAIQNTTVGEERDRLKRRIEKLEEPLPWRDSPLPEDTEIEEVGPWNDGSHEIYAEAMRLVGARHSKGALVAMTHWLLTRIEKLEEEKADSITEEKMLIAEDTKKCVFYSKDKGEWSWCDRDERDNPEAWHSGFKTAAFALSDAVEPYLQEVE